MRDNKTEEHAFKFFSNRAIKCLAHEKHENNYMYACTCTLNIRAQASN